MKGGEIVEKKNGLAVLILLAVFIVAIPGAFAEEPYVVIFCYANTGCQIMYPLMPADAKIVFIYTNLYQPPYLTYQDTKHFPFIPPAPRPYKQPSFNFLNN